MYSSVWPTWVGPWEVILLFLFPLAILVIPWVFFLLNLRSVLWHVHPQNRAMSPDQVWLTFIPVFSLGWFIYMVAKVRDSVRAEYSGRQWAPAADFGYNVGLAAGVLWICLALLWWVPFIGWAVGIAWLICWIIYWLKTADLKRQLQARPPWSGTTAPPPYWGSGPGAGPGPGAGSSQWGPGAGSSQWAPGPGAPGGGPWGAASAAPPSAPWQSGAAMPAGGPQTSPGAPGAPGSPGGAEPAPGAARPRQCAACGSTITPEDRFCRTCGLRLP